MISPVANPCTPSSRKVIATGPVATAELCSCGVVHLHLQALTIRLTPCAVRELSSVLAICEQATAEPSELHVPYVYGRVRGSA